MVTDVAAQATPWKAIIDGAASVVNNAVNGLFNSGVKKAEKNAIKDTTAANIAIGQLSNAQQYDLQQKLLKANSDAEKEAILFDALTKINQTAITTVGAGGKTNNNLILIAIVAVTLIAAAFILTKNK